MEIDIGEVGVADPHQENDVTREMTISVMTINEGNERKRACLP